jgi:thiol-disulfide isomerase/thioredoxin
LFKFFGVGLVLKKLFLAFTLLACVLFFGCVENALQTPQMQANASVAASTAPSASASVSVAASPSPFPSPSPSPIWAGSPTPGAWNDFKQREVVVDFLYADWCGHCAKMKPIVSEAERAFPAERLKVRWWNEANRTRDKSVMYVYDYYSRKRFFGGFPTFVVLGEYKRVGEMPRDDFFDWLCSFFRNPKPEACGEYANTTW